MSAEERRAFLLHLDAQSREVAHEVAALLAPRPWGRVVDVGCGLGTYAYALLKRRPGSVATLVDRPNAREPILERAEELGLVDRVTFADVDILGGDYGDTFDLAVLSNILHDYGEKDAKALLANAARRLVPGGLVAIKDYDIDADHRGSLDALTFRMCMAAFTDGGTLWSEAKFVSWLNELGLTHTATHALRADRGSYLVVGQVP